jgi:WD40 repeat protein
LWAVEDARAPTVLAGHEGAIRTVAFSPDGERPVTGGVDGTTRIWPLSAELLTEALELATRACLSAPERRQHLGETVEQAERAAALCLTKNRDKRRR